MHIKSKIYNKPKLRFRPCISRVKLNPEQAVLQCDCQTTGTQADFAGGLVEGTAYGTSSMPYISVYCASGERVNPFTYIISYPAAPGTGAYGATGSLSSS